MQKTYSQGYYNVDDAYNLNVQIHHCKRGFKSDIQNTIVGSVSNPDF